MPAPWCTVLDESSTGYLGKVPWLGAVCGNSCFIESFLAVECGWDQIIWELLALCSCQFWQSHTGLVLPLVPGESRMLMRLCPVKISPF